MSIRLRLTFWYAALTAITLIISSVVLYLVLDNSMTAETDAFLRTKAYDLGASTQVLGGPTAFWVRLPDVDRFVEADVYAQVLSDSGQILDESMSMGSYGMPMAPDDVSAGINGQTTVRTVTIRGVRIRVDTVPLRLPGEGATGPFHILQVGRGFAPVEATLAWLQRSLLIGDTILVVLAAAVGWFMSGSALRPIVHTTRAVQAIGESGRLDRRVEYTGPTDEVGELVHTFNRMLDRLESSIAAQRRFVADASHELRTPLTTLRLNVELLRRDRSAEPPERAEVLDDVGSELDRLSRLVQGLLDLARADAGMHLEKQSVRADEIVRNVFHQVRPTANGVALTTGDIVPIQLNANPDYLKQLLLTLVDNALKYTPNGGTVRLDLERDGRWVKFVVADTGRGISAEDLPHVFERFYRAKAVRSQRGTGLGLSVAQWIANEHGGHIDVTSQPGVGSTFTTWVPID